MVDDSKKWRGGFDDFTNPKALLIIFDVPNEWLLCSAEYRATQRKEALKDALVWAIGADIVEGFSEIDDQLFSQIVIPVRLTERAKQLALQAGEDRVVAWIAGLSESGVQVKLFAKSEPPGQFDVLDFYFNRSESKDNYTIFVTEVGEWNYGIIDEWRNSLPQVILSEVENQNFMDIPALKKLVSETYLSTDGDTTIPKFSAQFIFSDEKKQILIHIPVYEDALSDPLFGLILRVITKALPNAKLKPEELRQRLIAALEGKAFTSDELDIRGIIQTTGSVAHAITETRILISVKPRR